MFDVVALGELLIDFTPSGLSHAGNLLFERNPGGAPANVLACLAKLGKKTCFIGKVGNDQFGNFLKETLLESNIDASGLVFSDSVNTTLAFVHLDKNGDRSFSFYRNPGADMTLSENELCLNLIDCARIFHFGSVSMTGEPSRSATLKAVSYAKEKGSMISYDPNLRIPLWNSLDEARKVIVKGLEYANILKLSEEELQFITGESDLEKGTCQIFEEYGIGLIFVTLGKNGSFFRLGKNTGYSPAYDVATLDTTGAGDAFLGGALYKILEKGRSISDLTADDVSDFIKFANAAGSLATVKKGAIPAMPTLDEIKNCILKVPKIV